MGRVVVVGSILVWVRAHVEALPGPGETATALRAVRVVGGRGVDKAVAARCAGAEVVMVGAVGDDADGAWCARRLEEQGIGARLGKVPGAFTGLAVAARTGEAPATVLLPGAGEQLHDHAVAALRDLEPDDVVLVDLDVPRGVVSAVVAAAERREARAVLCASPYADVPTDALDGCDPCVVGERDAAALADAGMLPRSLCVSFAAAGAVWDDVRVDRASGAARPVPSIPDVLAGPPSDLDVFCGVLAAGLATGAERYGALRRAVDGTGQAGSTTRA